MFAIFVEAGAGQCCIVLVQSVPHKRSDKEDPLSRSKEVGGTKRV